ncbi:MAG: aminotransferase class I/II-fold pyridoxal phosphate-dependent enzyme [Thermoplasmatales archaeon]|jgi:aspartate/methionine/tyrosine aminotransferase|nr:MAG: aminotransferase class I/II-fold pyridoxal phosphate-dependent enzyme [Thermoplasmatales archaeon]
MIKASDRSKTVNYAIREVVVPARKLEKKGNKVLHLNIGDPNKYDFDTPQHMKDALYEASIKGHNGYSPSEGYDDLRNAIIKREKSRNNVDYKLDNTCITSGVTESLQILLNACMNPGDELLLPGPTYPQYTLITSFLGGIPVAYRCIEEEGWQPDVEDIRNSLSEKTKGIVLINPNNPTGALYSKKVIKEIVDLAGEFKLPIFSDEIYDDMVFEERQYATATIADDVPVVTMNGFSKVYLVPGWRIGYILFHHNGELDDVQDAFMRIARSRLCANSVCQKACLAALEGKQDHIEMTNDKLRKRRDFSYKRLNEIEGISTAKPQGAFYIFPKIDAMESGVWKSDKEFVLDLLHEKHVLVVHGSGFCSTYGKDHFRAVILPTIEILEESFNKLEDFLKERI